MIKEVEKVMSIKKQMKIQIFVKYRIKQLVVDDDKAGWIYKDVFNNSKSDSVSSNNISQVLNKF